MSAEKTVENPAIAEGARRIVVGVAGGIAAYKACHLIRDLKESGDDVRVIPTVSALQFVGAPTFEALSGNPVATSVFDNVDEVQHVRLGQDADAVVIAPATADLIARIAAGRADDLLTATILVATCPIIIAPAMHTEMWLNPATQDNVATLRRRGITVIEPAVGRLTGKDSGPGRLPDPAVIAETVRSALSGFSVPSDWHGKKVVISAGGTQENLDPVRFLGNRSSGRQGFALAETARQRGAEVVLVAGNVDKTGIPDSVRVIPVVAAADMQAAMDVESADADVVIMAAAVADYRPETVAQSKLKKGADDAALEKIALTPNPDILAGLVDKRRTGLIPSATVIVGFAAETGDPSTSALEFAQAKFERKGCDLLMVNDVSDGKVFGRSRNQGWILSAAEKPVLIQEGTKHVVAAQILDVVNAKMAD